jgi:predicted deacylase
LSVVCRELNARRIAAQRPRISAADVNTKPTDILRDFYERSFDDLPPTARIFVEDRLIDSSGYRNTVSAAAAGDGGVPEAAVEMLVRGVRNTLRRLEMLPGAVEPPPRPQQLVGLNVWLRSQHKGWWEPVVAPGDTFERGALLGRIRNLWGDVLQEVAAPDHGVVLFVTSSPAVLADGLLLGLGTNLSDA